MTFGITATDLALSVGIAGGINSLTGGGVSEALGIGPGTAPTGAQAQKMADPFMDYRANLGAMYAGALQPGAKTDITQMPGYSQFQTGVMDPALEASKRSGAASGMMRSGNEQIALEKQAQTGYYGFMTDYLNRLAQGSGATQNPATAAGMGLSTTGQNQQSFMQGLGALGVGAAAYAGNQGSGSPGYTVDPSGYGIGSGGMGTVDTANYGGAYGPSIR